jgi:DNA-binding CsgD family transcriptional regulator
VVKISPEALSHLIGEIYDCSLNQERWTGVLTKVSAIFDAAYTVISLSDPKIFPPVGRMVAFSPWDPMRLRELNESYGVDGVPGLREVALGDVDEPKSTFAQMSEEVFQQSDFYKDWVAPQGLREACVTKFVHTPDRIGVMAQITRNTRDPISADDRRFVALLSPHIRRASLIADLLDHQRVAAASYQSALNSLATPVVLTDQYQNIIFANTAADGLLQGGSVLASRDRKLHAILPTPNMALGEAIRRASSGTSSLGQQGIGIPLSMPGAAAAMAYVLPLAGDAERSVFGAATAAIFIAMTGQSSPPPEAALTALFDLTPAEARVMCKVSTGAANSEIAEQLNISLNTLKSHVARIYEKTKVSKHGDLVKLVAELTPPQSTRLTH